MSDPPTRPFRLSWTGADPPPWLGPLPPPQDAVAKMAKQETRRCSRLFCGDVHRFTGCGFDVTFQLEENIRGYTKLDVGERMVYLLPLRTDVHGVPNWRETVNVFPVSIYLPERANMVQHTRLTMTKGIAFDLTLKTRIKPLVEDLIRGGDCQEFCRLIGQPHFRQRDLDTPWAVHVPMLTTPMGGGQYTLCFLPFNLNWLPPEINNIGFPLCLLHTDTLFDVARHYESPGWPVVGGITPGDAFHPDLELPADDNGGTDMIEMVIGRNNPREGLLRDSWA